MAAADPQVFLARLEIAIGHDNFYSWGRQHGISDGVWQTIKRGSVPKVDTLLTISEATGRSIDWLLGRDMHMSSGWADDGFDVSPNTQYPRNAFEGRGFDKAKVHVFDVQIGDERKPALPVPLESPLPSSDRDAETQAALRASSGEFVYVPRYDVTASAGSGHWHDSGENAQFTMAFLRHWVEKYLNAKPKDLSVVRVHGDSMAPTLQDGDNILVNHADTEVNDGIYVVRIDDKILVKRTQFIKKDTIRIISENTSYPPYEVDCSEENQMDFEIIGRVVWFGRQM